MSTATPPGAAVPITGTAGGAANRSGMTAHFPLPMLAVTAGRIGLGVPACPPRSNLPWVWHTGRTIDVPAFRLSRTHVTNAAYAAFLADTGCARPPFMDRPGYDRAAQPVVGISWDDAVAYCGWLATKSGQPYRLPSDTEWEYAARGGREDSIFPWGDALDPQFACFGGQAAPRDVGNFPANGFGLCDMIGNAWAWCSDRFEDVSAGVKAVNQPTGKDPAGNRVLRGGSFLTTHYLNLWIAYRHEDPADLRHESIGFRVAL